MKTLLFCLPYAGGSATVYHAWRSGLNDHIELCPVELPGRGSRYDEPFASRIEQLVDDLAIRISTQAQQQPYILYGHSMGAVLAYELYHALIRRGCHPPEGIILSGRPAPDYNKGSRWSDLKERVLSFLPPDDRHMPAEIAAHPQLAAVFKRILQADIQMMSRYQALRQPSSIHCPLIVLAGKQDTIPAAGMEAWQAYAKHSFQVYWVDGDHFFIHSHHSVVLDIINAFTHATAYGGGFNQ